MRIDPSIEALRSDPASQRRLQDAVAEAQADWRPRADVKAVLNELDRYGQGTEVSELPNLKRLIDDHGFAREWVNAWARHWTRCLAANPLALMPMQHHRAEAFSSIQIAASGRAALSMAVYEQRAKKIEPASVVLSDSDQHEIILTGSATGLFHSVVAVQERKASVASAAMVWTPGDTISSMAQKSSRHVVQAEGQMSVLQLQRRAQKSAPTREYCLKTGALLRQTSGEKSASQHELAMAVLTAMQRRDAAPVIAKLSETGPDHRRWEAIRQSLGLDPVTGFAALQKIARTETDSLREHARMVQAQLIESHPQLAALKHRKDALCPA